MKFDSEFIILLGMKWQKGNAMSPKSPSKKLTFNRQYVKYGCFAIAFLFMLPVAVKVFINYETIQTSIEHVIAERASIIRHKQYLSIQSYAYNIPESAAFIAHDNSLLLPWEHIFLFTQGTWTVQTWASVQIWEQVSLTWEQFTPWQSWVHYFASKMEP